MNKSLITASLLSVALLASPVSYAAGNNDRAAATGAVVGATTGAIIGAGHNRPVQGAVVGAVLGTIVGVTVAGNRQPTRVIYVEPRHKPVQRVVIVHDHDRCIHDAAFHWRMHQRHERMEERREHAREVYLRHERREEAREHLRHERQEAYRDNDHRWSDRS